MKSSCYIFYYKQRRVALKLNGTLVCIEVLVAVLYILYTYTCHYNPLLEGKEHLFKGVFLPMVVLDTLLEIIHIESKLLEWYLSPHK